MDLLPNEIIKIILSLLNENTARIARLTCSDWFRWIKYSRFNIYFATSASLPQIVDRLSKYQHPIGLALIKSVHMTATNMIDNISRLTQLKSFQLVNPSVTFKINASNEDYFKLSTLSNLEIFDVRQLYFPSNLLKHFPRLKKSEFHSSVVLDSCPTTLESVIALEAYLTALPATLTELEVNYVKDGNLDELTRLTNLRRLSVPDISGEYTLDLQRVTWLENLCIPSTLTFTGLEHCANLTELSISSDRESDAKLLTNSLIALPQLKALKLNLPNSENVSLSMLPQLTSLWIYANNFEDLTSLVSLQYLHLAVESSIDLTDLMPLKHLTKLFFENCTILELDLLNSLTNLIEMEITGVGGLSEAFSNLTNLTYLRFPNARSITCLPNLEYLELSYSIITQEVWESLQFLTRLTSLQFCRNARSLYGGFDYTTLARLPLRDLQMEEILDMKNFAAVVPNMTTLESLAIERFDDDESILALTSLNKLTKLHVNKKTDRLTYEHLTSLTTLQDLMLSFKQHSLTDMSLKLTRLLRSHGINL